MQIANTTWLGKVLLPSLCLLCLLIALVRTGCHFYPLTEHTASGSHCHVCDLGSMLAAVVVILYALLSGRISHVTVRLIVPSYQRSLECWSFIQAPPIFVDAPA